MAREIVAVYRDRVLAEAARRDLIEAGFPPGRLHLHHAPGPPGTPTFDDRMGLRGTILGALLGFVIGGLFTMLLSFVPALSWVLASEDWASVIGGAAGGALLGAVAGGLGHRRSRRAPARTDHAPGTSLLHVDAEEHEVDRALIVMKRHRPERLDRGLPFGPGVERTMVAENRPRTRDEEPV